MNAWMRIAIASLPAALIAWSALARAQDYPVRPVRIVTGAPATMMDIVSRQLAQRLAERWGRPVVVENRRGSVPSVVAAHPDGYTLLIADSGALAIHPNLYRSLAYDPPKDFEPIALVASTPSMLVAHPSVPATDLRQFISYAKRQPAGVEFANPGPWTSGHLTAELFKLATGLNLVLVSYKGGGAATAAIVSGETKAGFSVPIVSLPHVRAGRLKVYAVTSAKRSVAMPEVPTMAEAGVGNLVTTYWFGLLAPAGVPQALLERINREAVDLLQSSELKARLLEHGAEPGAVRRNEFAAFIRSETARFKQVVEAAGLRAE